MYIQVKAGTGGWRTTDGLLSPATVDEAAAKSSMKIKEFDDGCGRKTHIYRDFRMVLHPLASVVLSQGAFQKIEG
jgi:hypothetical protein